jgi:hypothetical protein
MATGGISLDVVVVCIKAGVSGFGLGGPHTESGLGNVSKQVLDFKAAILLAKGL